MRSPLVRKPRLVTLILVFLVVSAALVVWSLGQSESSDGPPALGTYRLMKVTAGPEAVAQMSRLHGKGVGVIDGYIAHYAGTRTTLLAYVAKVASPPDATLLNKQMEDRIAEGNPYFAGLRPVSIGGKRVLSVKAGPETHYFWAEGSRVIWLGFEQDDPATLQDAVRAFR